jgi:PAS domain S-box-containing protein
VLDAVAQGLSNKEIAQNLGISEQRVKEVVSALLKKFEVRSRTALTRAATNMRILGLDLHDAIPYSYLFDEAPVLIAVTRGPEHRFVMVNSAYVQAFGVREYVGRTVREVFPDAPKEAYAALDRTYAGGERYAESEQHSVYEMPDGKQREFYLSFINEPIRSSSNEITGIALYGWDVTSLVAKRDAAESLSANHRRLLDTLPVGIIRLDADERILFINDAARLLVGGEEHSATAPHPELTLLNIDGAPFAQGQGPAALALCNQNFDGEALLRRADGKMFRIHTRTRPFCDEGGAITGVTVVIRD